MIAVFTRYERHRHVCVGHSTRNCYTVFRICVHLFRAVGSKVLDHSVSSGCLGLVRVDLAQARVLLHLVLGHIDVLPQLA